MDTAAPWTGHPHGSRGYRRATLALSAAGVATFAQLYSVQAVLPALADEWGGTASHAALSVSVATGALAVSVVGWSALADRAGRVPAMALSLLVATAVGLAVPLAGGLGQLLVLRALQGAALGGLPAVAMAYLAEELRGRDVAPAAAAYVAGTSLGGLSGRLVSSAVADLAGWRWGVAAVALLAAAATAVFAALVPRARGFARRRRADGGPRLAHRVRAALAAPGLLALYAQALLLMGGFVTVYNYLAFRLLDAPYSLSQTLVGSLFVVYLAGTWSSAAAGRWAARAGRLRVLTVAVALFAAGTALTAAAPLPLVVAGLVVLTAGFFAAHAVASGWVGALAPPGVRAQASALYTFGYYAGSGLLGWLGGYAFAAGGWPAVVAAVVACAVLALVLALLALRGAGTAPGARDARRTRRARASMGA
ncbi:MFS transporter [Kineococcus sp. SYSU DK004]|uniref:MFS transporter n=1 Tax=Kineococcus sp. SYSU DK004 TaxID=3383125 RepID=UPI003D7C6FB0